MKLLVTSEKDLDFLIDKLETCEKYSLDTEYVPWTPTKIDFVGISGSWNGVDSYYIPVGHLKGNQLPLEVVLERLKPILEGDKKRYYQNFKAEHQVFFLNGVYLASPEYFNHIFKYIEKGELPDFSDFDFKNFDANKMNFFDTMVASWLLYTDRPGGHGLKNLSKTILKHEMTELDSFTPIEKDPVTGDDIYRPDKTDIAEMADYACDDGVRTYQLGEYFEKKIYADEKLAYVFDTLEMQFMATLSEMELFGAPCDGDLLKDFESRIEPEMEALEKKAHSLRPSGEPFNLNSTKQLNEVLYDELKIKPIGRKSSKTGYYSMNAKNLELLAKRGVEIADIVLRIREIGKLESTYIEGMGARIQDDGRIHCSFLRTGTRTGRLSCARPNLQNLPHNDEFPIRQAFRATTNPITGIMQKWITRDHGQLEYRCGAHISKDPSMIQVYKDGYDLHARTAKNCFNLDCEESEVKKKYPQYRSDAKTVNFGIFYGMGAMSLGKEINTPEKEAQKVIDNFFVTYPEVKRFVDWSEEFVKKHGYIMTPIGRSRKLPFGALTPDDIENEATKKAKRQVRDRWEIKKEKEEEYPESEQRKDYGKFRGKAKSKLWSLKYKAYRQAVNTQVQGFASDIMAIGMRNIRKTMMEKGYWWWKAMMILQVHDEVSVVADEDIAEEADQIVKDDMEQCINLRVPLEADGSIETNWNDAK